MGKKRNLYYPAKKPDKCRVCLEDSRRTEELERILLRIDEIATFLATVLEFENWDKKELVLDLWKKYVNDDGDYVDLLRPFYIEE